MGLDSPVPRGGPVHGDIADNKMKTPVRRLRDLPPYQELEDDKFFILSFEKRRERKSKKRESLEGKNKENENPEKSKRKMGKKYAVSFENEGDSENSSPNSVLEFLGYSADQESVSSGL